MSIFGDVSYNVSPIPAIRHPNSRGYYGLGFGAADATSGDADWFAQKIDAAQPPPLLMRVGAPEPKKFPWLAVGGGLLALWFFTRK